MKAPPLHLLEQVVSIQRAGAGVSAQGAPVVSWAPHVAGVPARVEALRTHEGRWRVFIPAGLDVQVGDRVLYGTRVLDILHVARLQETGSLTRLIAQEGAHA